MTTVIITLDGDDPFPGTPFQASDIAPTGSVSISVSDISRVDWSNVTATVVHNDALEAGLSQDWLYEKYVAGTIIIGFDIDSETFSLALRGEPGVLNVEGNGADYGKKLPLQVIRRLNGSTVGAQIPLYDVERGYMDNVVQQIELAVAVPHY